MIKIFLVCMMFTFSEEGPVELKDGTHTQIVANMVEVEMKDMQECLAAKHQLEMMPPPPPAFAHGYYCEKRSEVDI